MMVTATTIAPRNFSGYLKPVEKFNSYSCKPEADVDNMHTPFS